MSTIIDILKRYWVLSILAVVLIFGGLFGKPLRRMFAPARRKRRRSVKPVARRRTRTRINRRPLPRSVGTRRAKGRGYPKAGGGYIPYKKNKDGSIKKAAFVAGTLAAKRRMASLRKRR